jgi:hypothetical protein
MIVVSAVFDKIKELQEVSSNLLRVTMIHCIQIIHLPEVEQELYFRTLG